mgnify:CR=1 FL=1
MARIKGVDIPNDKRITAIVRIKYLPLIENLISSLKSFLINIKILFFADIYYEFVVCILKHFFYFNGIHCN